MRLSPLAFVSVPLLLASACTMPGNPESGPRPSVSRGAIVGGTKDTGDPGVVLLYGEKKNSNSASLCTGEVVSPHVVLTAAHCVDPAVLGTGYTFSIFLGDDLNNQQQVNNASNWVDVASTDFNMAFDVNNLEGGNDIAVAITATALPVTPIAINTDPITNSDMNATLRLVGFGVTSMPTQTDTSGTRRQVSTTLQQFDSKFLAFGDATHNTCEGDSGGPAFMTRNGKELIVGVTSFGDQNCQQGGVDTRVDSYYTSFIAPRIMMADGSLPNPGNPSTTDGGTSTSPGDMGDSVTPGQVAGANQSAGASCTDGNQCASGICTLGSNRYCTQPCDPANASSCADGMHCGQVSGANYCLLTEHGCSASARPFAAGGGALAPFLLLAFAGLASLLRRRRHSRAG